MESMVTTEDIGSSQGANPSHYGSSQEELFASKLGLSEGYVAVSPFGGGKSSLAKMEIRRMVEEAGKTGKSTYIIMCSWKQNCPHLMKEYQNFINELPTVDNIQVKLCTRNELGEEYKLNLWTGKSTNELNSVCKAISDAEDRDIFLVVDEVRVEYFRATAARYMTTTSNVLVGNMPFHLKGALFPWSGLQPGKVKLLVFVTPESEYFVEKEKIDKAPPAQSPPQTFFLPRSLRATQRHHSFLTFVEDRIQRNVRQYGAFLMPPEQEISGGKTEGKIPEWVPVDKTEHLLCEVGSKCCLLLSILPSLAAKIRELEDLDKVARSDVGMVVLGTSSEEEQERVRAWMSSQFPDTVIFMEEEMTGIEMPNVFSIGNVNHQKLIFTVPSSISRAKERFFLFCHDYLHIFEDACKSGFLKKKSDLSMLNKLDMEDMRNPALRNKHISKVQEVIPVLMATAWEMPPESVEQLSLKLDQGETYRELINRPKEPTREEVIQTVLGKWITAKKGVSLLKLKVALRGETVKLDKIVTYIEVALRENLQIGVGKMETLIDNNFFTAKEVFDIAFHFGFKERHLMIREDRKKPTSEKMALIRCLDIFVNHAPSDYSSRDLADKLLEINLRNASDEVFAMIETPKKVAAEADKSSDITKNPEKPYEGSVFNLAFPGISLIFTLTMMCLLMMKGLYPQGLLTLLLLWFPSMPVMMFHMMEQLDNLLLIMESKKMLYTLLLIPVSDIKGFFELTKSQHKLKGRAMRNFYLIKILDFIKNLKVCNSLTSLSMVILILIFLNTGSLNLEFRAINVVSLTCGILHLFNLIVTIMRSWHSTYNFLTTILLCFPLSSSVILRILPVVLFLSAEFTPITFALITFFPIAIISINYILEWKLFEEAWDETAADEARTKPVICFRAAVSFVFPLPPKLLTKRNLILANLQMVVSNGLSLISVILAVTFIQEQTFWMIPQNLLKSLPLSSFFLMVQATLVFSITTAILKKMEEAESEVDENQRGEDPDGDVDADDDVTASSSLIIENIPVSHRKENFLLSLWSLVCIASLLASIATAPILMMTIFNTCPVLHSSQYGNITCDNTSPIIGTECMLSCTNGFPSEGSLNSTCGWTGQWSNSQLGCSSIPSSLILGRSYDTEQLSAELYNPDPPFQKNITVQPLPHSSVRGILAYVDGTAIACGGFDQDENTVTSTCFTLSRENKWIKSASLLQERNQAAIAVIHQGAALWVLGGADKNYYAYSSTMILQNGHWRWGPDITSPRFGSRAVTLNTGDVLLAGGSNDTTNLDIVEKFSFNTMSWTTQPRLNHPRALHSCSHVWLTQDGDIDTSVDDTSVSTAIVAGGAIYDYSSKHWIPVTSVEMLWDNRWILLPPLPTMHYYSKVYTMSVPTSLGWFPSWGVILMGGCWRDYVNDVQYCTTHVWKLELGETGAGLKYHWFKTSPDLDTAFFQGNSAILVPYDYFD